MEDIVGIINGLSGGKKKRDDDIVDRLSCHYTVVILVMFSAVVAFTQYIGEPITCWEPVHFTDSHTAYMNSYCWVRNTYFLPWETDYIPRQEEPKQHILYYQWISFILLSQAVLFYMPSCVWHGFNEKAGVDADNILRIADSFTQTQKMKKKSKHLRLLTNQLDRSFKHRSGYVAGMNFRVCGGKLGSYLVILFLISKLLYIANVVGQLFLLNNILSAEYNFYGFEVMGGMLQPDHDWAKSTSVVFPRVTMCDFRVRRLGNVHRYTVQCVLPINLYTEKIYVFLWFWMVFVAAASVLGFVVWLARTVMRGDKVTYVNSHLKAINKLNSETKGLVDGFIDEYLRQDGVFLLRLIGHNTNNITVTEIMGSLFDKYQEHVENELGANKQNNQLGDLENQPDTYPGDQGGLDAPDQAGPLPEKAPMLE